MKPTLILFFCLIVLSANAQQSQPIPYCDCTDKIDQIKPTMNGKFQRTCKGTVIETGAFKDGNKDGEWVTYNKKGIVIRKINYSNGSLNGKFEAFNAKGTLKLTAFFHDDKKEGKWVYYTAKGKVFIEGEYDDGNPINVWTVYDAKGNRPAIKYDFSASKYLQQDKVEFYHNRDIIQNDNTTEYLILRVPEYTIKDDVSTPLGGYRLAANMFTYLVEIPQDYWDTYINYNYTASFKISDKSKSELNLTRIPYNSTQTKTGVTMPTLAETNPSSKIKRVDHSELSRLLLNYKIKEALNVLPPFIYNGKPDATIDLYYVVNRIVDFSKPADREYE